MIYSLVIFIIFCLLSFINSISLEESFKSLINVVLYSCLFFIVVEFFKDRKQIERMLNILLLPAVVTSVYCCFQYYGYDLFFLPRNVLDLGSYVVVGFIDNPNVCAGYLVLHLPLVMYKLWG